MAMDTAMATRQTRVQEQWLIRLGMLVVLGLAAVLAWRALAVAPMLALAPAPTFTSPGLQFEPNRGQAPGRVRYLAHGTRQHAAIFDDGAALSVELPGGGESRAQLRFVGTDPRARLDARAPTGGRAHYLLGRDSSAWIRDLPRFGQLRQEGLYPGIDLVWHGSDGELEFDLVVQPGADPAQIRLQLDSASVPVLDDAGDLRLDGPDGALRLHRPLLYQHIDGRRVVLPGRFVLGAGGELRFALPEYDRRHPLVIDPVFKLLYASYLGGVHDDQVGAMVLDAQGNAYVVGNSGSEDWPVSGNAYQATRKALGRYVRNVVVTKFDAAGTLIYSTFIGGTTNDYGKAIAVDAAGRAWIAGATESADFPVTAGAYQAGFAGSQSGYLAALSPDGAALDYATLYGGSGGASVSSLVLEASGTLLAGGTAGPGLPTTAGAYQPSSTTGHAAFVARFDPAAAGAAQLRAATYYGAAAADANNLDSGNYAHTMAVDPSGSPWIAGQAFTRQLPLSANAPIGAPTAMSPNCSPGTLPLNSFGYVARLSADLATLRYASYLTGASGAPATCSEFAWALAFDSEGRVYVGGSTASLAFPTTAGALQATSPANNGLSGYSGFVTKLEADGSAILWSTYLGGSGGNTFMSGLRVDGDGALWVGTSSGGGSNFPISADAFQKLHGGGSYDATFTRLDGATGALLYSSFFGGSGDDGLGAFAVDAGGTLRLAGTTNSTNLPVSANAFQPALTPRAYDGSDWFVAILGSGTISQVRPASSGNAGDVTLTLAGAGLQVDATATLVSGATTIAAGGGLVDPGGAGASFGFALDGAAPGSYDLRIDNPDGTSITRRNAFTVSAGGAPQLAVQVLGRPKFRTGVPTTFQVVVTNSGTQQALMTPLWIAVPSSVTLAIDNFSVDETAAMLATTEGATSYVSRLIGRLAPGESATVAVHLTTAADAAFVPVTASLQAPWFRTAAQMDTALGAATFDTDCVPDPANAAYSNCFGLYQNYAALGSRALAQGAVRSPDQVAALAARKQALGDVCKAFDHGKEMLDKGRANGKEDLGKGKGPGDDGSAFKRDVPNPAKDPIGWINYNAGYYQGQIDVVTSFFSGSGTPGGAALAARKQVQEASCPISPPPGPPPSLQPRGGGGGGSGGAIDPNDKVGPAGDGSSAHYLRPGLPLGYQIQFENQPTASLPAATVVVTDQLDLARIDPASFTLGPISFGSTTIAVPPGLASYQTTVDLGGGLALRVQGSFDTGSGLARWTFTTLDAATHLPPSDPTLGFLPPDTDGVRGQGAVNFAVRPRAGLADGSTWSNQASIVFDANAPIATPTWVNTLDTSAPTSRVQALTGQPGSTAFDVQWSGSDSGSGVRGYSVYVSEDGGAFQRWQTDVTATHATFAGVSGHQYGFYVVAADGAGNIEPAKSAAEASIRVDGNFVAGSSGDGGGGGCTIGGDTQRDAGLPLLIIGFALWRVRRRSGARE